MCFCSIFLFVLSASAEYLNKAVVYLFIEHAEDLQNGLVSFLSFFGIGKGSALAVSKLFLSSGIVFQFVSFVSVIVTMVLPAAIFSKAAGLSFDSTFRTDGKILGTAALFFCFIQLITTAVSQFSGYLYDFIVPSVPGIYDGSFTPSSPDVYSFIMSVLITCILVPFAEEYVFRGVLFTYLKRYGLGFGIISSACLFGIAHASPTQTVYALVFGIFSALLVAVTGNIKTSIILHSANNFVSVFFGYLQGATNENISYIFSWLYCAVITAIAFFGIFLFVKDGGFADTFRQKESQNDACIAEKNGMKQLLVFPFVVYVIIYAIDFTLKVM